MHTTTRQAIQVVLLCLIWYSISSCNNVVGKVVLNNFPFPLTVTMVQLGSIAVYTGPVLAYRSIRPYLENMDWGTYFQVIMPLVAGKFFASLTSHVSLWKVPVSYAHTVKATMPFFTVILSRLILGESQTLKVYLSLVPIIIGVMIATMTELSFDMIGLLSALTSTIVFALQNIYTKKRMTCLVTILYVHILATYMFSDSYSEPPNEVMRDRNVHHLRLLHTLARLALLFFLPVWFIFDLPVLVRNPESTSRVDFSILCLLFLDGFLNFAQNLVAFTMLHLVTPLTYSVCNASKRIAVIAFSLLMLHNPVTATNVFGMLLAVSGVLLYNKAKYDAARERNSLPTKLSTINGGKNGIRPNALFEHLGVYNGGATYSNGNETSTTASSVPCVPLVHVNS